MKHEIIIPPRLINDSYHKVLMQTPDYVGMTMNKMKQNHLLLHGFVQTIQSHTKNNNREPQKKANDYAYHYAIGASYAYDGIVTGMDFCGLNVDVTYQDLVTHEQALKYRIADIVRSAGLPAEVVEDYVQYFLYHAGGSPPILFALDERGPESSSQFFFASLLAFNKLIQTDELRSAYERGVIDVVGPFSGKIIIK